jgi:ligand-binding SRPBCC domain-containing protein
MFSFSSLFERMIVEVRVFEYHSIISTSVEQMVAFHESPDALRILTPPPLILQRLRDERTSLISGEVEFRLWFGPLPIRWLARHEPGPIETSFIDRMIRGPLAQWEHQHLFRKVGQGVELIDRIAFAHKPGVTGLLTRVAFDGLLLRFLFLYRHWRTRRALTNHY